MGFDVHAIFSLLDGSGFSINTITFGTVMSSSLHFDYKKNDSLNFGDPKYGLDNTMLTTPKEHTIYFTKQQDNFFLVFIIMDWIYL